MQYKGWDNKNTPIRNLRSSHIHSPTPKTSAFFQNSEQIKDDEHANQSTVVLNLVLTKKQSLLGGVTSEPYPKDGLSCIISGSEPSPNFGI